MTHSRLIASSIVALGACTFSMLAAAGPYSSVYVFGDSLSDMGRVAALTGGTFPGPPDYAAGRFSNGPVAVEVMTQILTGAPLTLSHDYAFGGALTGTGNKDVFPGSTQTGLLSQVGLFNNDLKGQAADPNALYVVWAGSNNFSASTPPNAVQMITDIETAIGALAADGAKHFFVPNIPNLGLTPAAATLAQTIPGIDTLLTGASFQFDQALSTSLTQFDTVNPTFDIKQFDVFGLLTTIVAGVQANGSYLGLTDVTSQCQTSCADASTSLFWDDEHPTAAAHQILGNAFAVAAVPEPSTYAMLFAGLGVVGWVARRRAASGSVGPV